MDLTTTLVDEAHDSDVAMAIEVLEKDLLGDQLGDARKSQDLENAAANGCSTKHETETLDQRAQSLELNKPGLIWVSTGIM